MRGPRMEGTVSQPRPLLAPADRQPSRPYVLAVANAVHLVWKEFDGNKTQVRWQVSHDGGRSGAAPHDCRHVRRLGSSLLVAVGERAYLSWLTKLEGYRLIPLGAGHKRFAFFVGALALGLSTACPPPGAEPQPFERGSWAKILADHAGRPTIFTSGD